MRIDVSFYLNLSYIYIIFVIFFFVLSYVNVFLFCCVYVFWPFPSLWNRSNGLHRRRPMTVSAWCNLRFDDWRDAWEVLLSVLPWGTDKSVCECQQTSARVQGRDPSLQLPLQVTLPKGQHLTPFKGFTTRDNLLALYQIFNINN